LELGLIPGRRRVRQRAGRKCFPPRSWRVVLLRNAFSLPNPQRSVARPWRTCRSAEAIADFKAARSWPNQPIRHRQTPDQELETELNRNAHLLRGSEARRVDEGPPRTDVEPRKILFLQESDWPDPADPFFHFEANAGQRQRPGSIRAEETPSGPANLWKVRPLEPVPISTA